MNETPPQEHHETQQASMLNFAATGAARAGFTLSLAFTVLSALNGQKAAAVVFGLGTLAQAGLCWLDHRHLKAHDGKARPYIEPQERAQQRCRGAFQRLAAPLVVAGATFLLVNVADPTPEPPNFPKPQLRAQP